MNKSFKEHIQAYQPVLSSKPVERSSAVAVLIAGREGEERVLMFRRAEQEGDPWSGHIAFPGGRKEKEDCSLNHTAMREAGEEMGFSLKEAEFLGRLSDLYHPRILVAAFVFYLPELPLLVPNEEVDRPYWFKVSQIFASENHSVRSFNTFNGTQQLPSVELEDAVIWGISLSILNQLRQMWS